MRRFRHFLTCNKIHTLCYWLFTPSLKPPKLLLVPRTHGLPFLFSSLAVLVSACNPPLEPLYPPVSREKHDYEP